MKKFFKIFLVIVLVAAIGIGGFFALKRLNVLKSPDDSSLNNTPTESTTESLLGKPIESSGSTLTEAELKALYETANDLYVDWVMPAFGPKIDWDTIVYIDGQEYAPVIQGKYSTVDEIKNDLSNYFSEEVYIDYINENFVMYEDKLYANYNVGQGGDADCDGVTLTINSSSETECKFTVTLVYDESSFTKKFNYELKVIDGKWKFVNEFDCSIILSTQDNIKWN